MINTLTTEERIEQELSKFKTMIIEDEYNLPNTAYTSDEAKSALLALINEERLDEQKNSHAIWDYGDAYIEYDDGSIERMSQEDRIKQLQILSHPHTKAPNTEEE